jgi:hypothetical protein
LATDAVSPDAGSAIAIRVGRVLAVDRKSADGTYLQSGAVVIAEFLADAFIAETVVDRSQDAVAAVADISVGAVKIIAAISDGHALAGRARSGQRAERAGRAVGLFLVRAALGVVGEIGPSPPVVVRPATVSARVAGSAVVA